MAGAARIALALVVTVGGALACKKEAPPPAAPPPPAQGPAPARAESAVRVTEIQLGTGLGEDKRVKTVTTNFGKTDTIHAAVITEGTAPAAELTAKWTYQDGQVVNETKRSITPSGVAITEFSVQKPDGWPVGDYKLEVALDGKPVESRTFKVQ